MRKRVLGTHRTPNGYTVSVIDHGYGSLGQPYEIGCWETVSGDWNTPAPFEGDVLGYQTRDDVLAVLAAVAEWPAV